MLVSHVNTRKTVSSVEADFNYRVGRMIHSVDTHQPLLQPLFVIIQWTHEPSGRGGRDGGMPGLSNVNFHTPMLIWLSSLLNDQPINI